MLANAPALPELTAYLWGYFCDLDMDREQTGFGMRCLTSRNILDWSELNDIELERWELAAIKRIDMAYLMSQKGTDSDD